MKYSKSDFIRELSSYFLEHQTKFKENKNLETKFYDLLNFATFSYDYYDFHIDYLDENNGICFLIECDVYLHEIYYKVCFPF